MMFIVCVLYFYNAFTLIYLLFKLLILNPFIINHIGSCLFVSSVIPFTVLQKSKKCFWQKNKNMKVYGDGLCAQNKWYEKMDTHMIEEQEINENPWSVVEDDVVVPKPAAIPSSDSLNSTENVWDQEAEHDDQKPSDSVQVPIDTNVEETEMVVPSLTEEVVETMLELDVPSINLENAELDDDDDDDDFGSFEEQQTELPNFKHPIGELMEIIFPNLPESTGGISGLKYSPEVYTKLTSSKRQYKQSTQHNYNRMNYWSQSSAMNNKAKEIINHWTELEQGFNNDGQQLQQQQQRHLENTHALFNWSSKDHNNHQQGTTGKKFENNSHQDQLLKIVMDEVSTLIERTRQQELELQRQRWKNSRSKNLKKITPSLVPLATPSVSLDKNSSKKKFSIGNFFKFNKKSSISKDHISSSNLKIASELQESSNSNSRKPDLVDLVSEFERSRKEMATADVEDADDDNDDNEMSYEYNNLTEQLVINDPEESDDEDTSLTISSLSVIPPVSPTHASTPQAQIENDDDDDDDFNQFVSSPVSETHPYSSMSMPINLTEHTTRNDATNDDDDNDDDEEFEDFVASPSPVPRPATPLVRRNNNDQNFLIDL